MCLTRLRASLRDAYLHNLTTYLTPTSGGADGNNGEIGLKIMRKGYKTAEKRPKTGIGRLVVCLGPGEFAGSNPVTPTIQPPVAREFFSLQAVFTVSPPFPR